ncbi:hypothetical protein ACFPMF_09290 [Larkinella bovis]|uniref:Uncharacterized protein n=1 Tax=Larkinella bovis TaxID=683041 RepID=A0ABW0IAD5_9BACT
MDDMLKPKAGRHSLMTTGLLLLTQFVGYSQCVVSRDDQGRLITVCQERAQAGSFLQNRPDFNSGISSPVAYLGSPYFSYPVWQNGTLELDYTNQRISCQLAYDLTTNRLLSRFENSPLEHPVLPAAFTLNGTRFVSLKARRNRVYYQVLYDGRLQLLKHTRCRLHSTPPAHRQRDDRFDGYFACQSHYYVKRNHQKPQPVSLNRPSILRALDDSVHSLAGFLTKKRFNEGELIEIARLQDSRPQTLPAEKPVPEIAQHPDGIVL